MTEKSVRPVCGIVMPISSIDGCNESHWADVLEILTESIEACGFSANLVSNADDVGIIHKRIIQNLYDNPIVVCDVSGKNPNVMFELGMRLAFDKPTIIVKDDKTSYSFDTSAIEHIEYPRDLRFSRIVEFKEKLAAKVRATHEKATSDPAYTTFLKHFGEFTVAKLEKKEVSGTEFILEELRNLRLSIRRMEHGQYVRRPSEILRNRDLGNRNGDLDICLGGRGREEAALALDIAAATPQLTGVRLVEKDENHFHLVAALEEGADVSTLELEKSIGARVRRRPGPKRPTEKV